MPYIKCYYLDYSSSAFITIYYKKLGLQESKIETKHRSYPVHFATKGDHDSFEIYDMPTILTGIDKAIDMYFKVGHIGKKTEQKLAEEKQKMQTQKREPESYTNFCMSGDGKLYAVGLAPSQRISIINTVGNNIYPSGDYGETLYESDGTKVTPIFSDIAVNSKGIIFVAEEKTSCIYLSKREPIGSPFLKQSHRGNV